MQGLIGKKVGMTRITDKDTGIVIPVTVIQTGMNVVCQVKTKAVDGYRAVQLGFQSVAEKKLTKPELGHCKKHNVSPVKVIHEFDFDSAAETLVPGQQIGVEIFENVKTVNVVGVSKGRGFTGTIKRHNFKIGRMTHGNTNRRERGSSGSNTYPGRVFLGLRMSGQYGAAPVTTKNLQVVAIDKDDGLVFIKGAIPGANRGIVYISKNKLRSK